MLKSVRNFAVFAGLMLGFSNSYAEPTKAHDSIDADFISRIYSNRFDVYYKLQEAHLAQIGLQILSNNGGAEETRRFYHRPNFFDWRSFIEIDLTSSGRQIWVSSTDKYLKERDGSRKQIGSDYLIEPNIERQLFSQQLLIAKQQGPRLDWIESDARAKLTSLVELYSSKHGLALQGKTVMQSKSTTGVAAARQVFRTESNELCEASAMVYSVRANGLPGDNYLRVICLNASGTLARPIAYGGWQ